MAAPPVYRPQLHPLQAKPATPVAAVRPIPSAAKLSAPPFRAHAPNIQLKPQKVVLKGQDGHFIYGNKQIHLHLDIGKGDHLTVEGQRINILSKGGLPDSAKMQEALQYLDSFKKSIAKDKPRANRYKDAIQDCVDWLQGELGNIGGSVSAPATTAPTTSTTPPPITSSTPTGGHTDFYASMSTSTQSNQGKVNEDDFFM